MSTTSNTTGGSLPWAASTGDPRRGLFKGRIVIIIGLLLLGIGLR